MVISARCICATTFFIVSIGHGEPAMIPVRRRLRSKVANSGWSSSAMNIVGTPCSAVQPSSDTAASVAPASKISPGNTIAAPLDTQASTASTMPKQWYSGTGMQSLSASVKRIAAATAIALLTTLWCVSVAPLGWPVVPLVNWMLIGSKQPSVASIASSAATSTASGAASTSA